MNHPAIPFIARFLMILLLLACAPSAEAQLKLAFVRSGYILRNFTPYQEAMKKYQEFEKTEVDKLQKRASDFQQKVADSQKQAAFMTEDKIKERSMELEKEMRRSNNSMRSCMTARKVYSRINIPNSSSRYSIR